MTKTFQPLFSDAYLRTAFADEYTEFRGSQDEQALIRTLGNWHGRTKNLTETQEEGSFMDTFFKQLWGYYANGEKEAGDGFSRFPKYKVAGAGQTGGTGEADLALGWFDRKGIPSTPQVLCEFKDIRSNLDAKQNRKGNTRSPVKQCADYLREAGKELYGNEAIQPTWGIVTNMNEFRLYWRNRMPAQYQRFVITTTTMDDTVSLLAKTDEASFQRFLFIKLFHADALLTTGGDCLLQKILHQQWMLEKEIESDFYKEYKEYRLRIYNALVTNNPEFLKTGTRGRLVRLAQKLIDRCIFVLFCEDMGEALSFPPNALRDFLKDFSKANYYDPDAADVWNKLKELFRAMDKGEKFLGQRINRFNGGLFKADSDLDDLFIPNHVFCEKLQGENETTIKKHPRTLLYLSAVYNFGTSGVDEHAITLYTLGRIFEQSITELEALEAEADGQISLTKETKRKRDGVYYTPEWIVEHIVEETIGVRLQEIRNDLGWSIEIEGDDDYVRKQKKMSPSNRSKKFNGHVDAVEQYRKRLSDFKVCDPACGSGAFLIHVLEYLLRERLKVSQEYARVTRQGEGLFEVNTEREIREILSRNIYGVDINPSSIEITKLALWLHTAKPNQALCDLDENIRDGNSLIGPEFGNFKQLSMLNADKQDEINVFDWEAAFPKVFDENNPNGKGFDCVVGNPPYVKFQNFKKKYAEVADFLKNGINADGSVVYQSTQKGNFDLFLPFIEKSIHLLNDKGRLGFIAPSLWRYNEYGEGLRQFLYDGRYLDRWIDFGSFQVFDEAITYTALQFYSKTQKKDVHFVFSHDGAVSDTPDWDDPNWCMSYKELPQFDPWDFVPGNERAVIQRLQKDCLKLGDKKVTKAIFVGVQTSADHIYHLQKLGPSTYLHSPKSGDPYEVTIEDAIMRPLVSGPEAKRYTAPDTDTYILFPYKIKDGQLSLPTAQEMQTNYPNAWTYLRSYEKKLRARESGKFDDDQWYRFGRHQNIDKQDSVKLMAPRLIHKLFVSIDHDGNFCLDNVDVGGIIPSEGGNLYFLAAIMNCTVTNFVWRRTSKPFQNDYRSANKQFIAPLPVPKATKKQKKDVGDRAKALQELHTERRDKLEALEKRFSKCPVKKRNEDWLFPQVGNMDHWKDKAPDGLSARNKTKWAKDQRTLKIEEQLKAIEARLNPSAQLAADFKDGELSFGIDGVPVIELFMNDGEGQHILTYWWHLARTTSITEKFKGKTLICKLMATPMTNNADLSAQITKLTAEIDVLDSDIAAREQEINEIIYGLYGLTPEEQKMVEES
ncbi:Eco57I restriction-modification methylase domain-containing protein [Thalassospira sp.]|uniref:Eco57I restriction-modification methylase domain-containing protein n=1 Tax=Thalassospira sp. TaxID=1912094 RepID=UPI003AA833CB